MRVNGSNPGELFDFPAKGSRLRFTRDVGSIVMDTNGLEQVELMESTATTAKLRQAAARHREKAATPSCRVRRSPFRGEDIIMRR
jgi:hypothetical protein